VVARYSPPYTLLFAMRVLDRYIALTFTKVFLVALLTFSVGLVALDYFARLDQFAETHRVAGSFAEHWSRGRLVFHFYLAVLPFLLKEALPFICVVSGLLTLTAMLHNNEVFPVVAAGVSARRLFLPLFLCGAAVSVGYLLFQELVVPTLSREQIVIKRFFSGDRKRGLSNLSHLRDGHGTVTRAAYYRFHDRALVDVVVQRPWTRAGFDLWTAPSLLPDGDTWVAEKGARVQPAGVDSLPRTLPPGTRVDIGITPDEVDAIVSKEGSDELSYSQLALLVDKFPRRRHLRVALHKQVARPFAAFVLLLVGVPILLATGRSYVLGAAAAFGISVVYYGLDIFFTSLGNRGDLPAVFAAYFPLALLLSLGVARLAVVPT
jgi:lipopolysaccharide export system permease protein